ncbi:MAG: hypothetical protein J2P36_17780, partial [Ktedonobacteraceae bacterium]|nr:hypothetical protein [Ktedonobacteraceae bacterium]
ERKTLDIPPETASLLSRRPTMLAHLALRAQAVCKESGVPTLRVIWRQGRPFVFRLPTPLARLALRAQGVGRESPARGGPTCWVGFE